MNRLISAYRRDDYADANGFVTQAAMVLADYPDDVIEYVCNPKTGIQSKQKFAPVIAEIVDACNSRMEAKAREKSIEEWHERKAKSDMLRAAGLKREADAQLGGMTYGEFLKRCEANGVNPRPIGRFEAMSSKS